MKISQKVWLTNPVEYARGNTPSLTLLEHGADYMTNEGWIELCTIAFEVDLEREKFVPSALDELDAKEAELKAQYHTHLKEIENARNDLKALAWDKTA